MRKEQNRLLKDAPLKTKFLVSILKMFRFPELPQKPKTGKWYRISLPDCVTASGDVTHGAIRIGTENKLIVMFHGGGVSWNEYMAARPESIYRETTDQRFYASESDLIADLVTGHGVAGSKGDNPFRNWTVISIIYNTGDFHVGTNDYPYADLDGKQQVLHHHGYTNYREVMKAAMKWIHNSPEKILVTGFSAGGFGTALLTDDVIKLFPDCQDITCYPDSSFMLYDGWHEAAEHVWKAPKEICDRLHSNNLTLDCLQALKKEHGDRVKVLFSCSTRDSALSMYWNYVKSGRLFADKETGLQFQKDLKTMCEQMLDTIPNVGIYFFDTLVSEKSSKELREAELTEHCIGLSKNAEILRVDGKTVVEWVWNGVNGNSELIGMSLLDKSN